MIIKVKQKMPSNYFKDIYFIINKL